MRFSSVGVSPWNFSAPHPNGLPTQGRNEEEPRWKAHRVRIGGKAVGRVEPRIESAVEIGEVLAQAVLRIVVCWVDGIYFDERDRQELLDLDHCRDEALALGIGERLQH